MQVSELHLSHVGALARLDRPALQRLSAVAELMRLGPDECLFRCGEQPRAVHFVFSGQIAILAPRYAAREAEVDVIDRPCWLGLPAAILGAPSVVSARTRSAAQLLAFPAGELWEVVTAVPSVAAAFLQEAARQIQRQATEICQLKLRSAAQRLAAYLVDAAPPTEDGPARFVLAVDSQALAARIACSPSNLSRTFRELESFGVRARSRAVIIEDLAGLREYAGLGSRPSTTNQSRAVPTADAPGTPHAIEIR